MSDIKPTNGNVARPPSPELEMSHEHTAAGDINLTAPLHTATAAALDLIASSQNDQETESDFFGDAETLAEWVARAEWFEQEAQADVEPDLQASYLLSASELWAMTGNISHARSLADQAVKKHATSALAQARQLAVADQDMEAVGELIDAELDKASNDREAYTAESQAHLCFFAAELARLNRADPQATLAYLKAGALCDPHDPRPALYQLARQLVPLSDAPSVSWPQSSECAQLIQAADELQELHGKPMGAKPRSQLVGLVSAKRALDDGAPAKAAAALSTLFDGCEESGASQWLAACLLETAPGERHKALPLWQRIEREAPSPQSALQLSKRLFEQAGSDDLRSAVVAEQHASGLISDTEWLAWELLSSTKTKRKLASESDAEQSLLWCQRLLGPKLSNWDLPQNARPQEHPEPAVHTETDRRLAFWLALAQADQLAELDDFIKAQPPMAEEPELLTLLRLEHAIRSGTPEPIAKELVSWYADPGTHCAEGVYFAIGLLLESLGSSQASATYYQQALNSQSFGEAALRALPLSTSQRSERLADLVRKLPSSPRRDFLIAELTALGFSESNAHLLNEEADFFILSDPIGPAHWVIEFLGELSPETRTADVQRSVQDRLGAALDDRERALLLLREALSGKVNQSRRVALIGSAQQAAPGDLSIHQALLSETTPKPAAWAKQLETLAEHTTDLPFKAALSLVAAWHYESGYDPLGAARLSKLSNRHVPSSLAQDCFIRNAGGTDFEAELTELLARSFVAATDAAQKVSLAQQLARLAEDRGEFSKQGHWLRQALSAAPDALQTLLPAEQYALEQDEQELLIKVESEIAKHVSPAEAVGHIALAARLVKRHQGTPVAFEILRQTNLPSASRHVLRQIQAGARREQDDLTLQAVCQELGTRDAEPHDRARLLYEAAHAAARRAKPEQACELAEEAARLAPTHLLVQDLRASLLEERGDRPAAAMVREQVAQLSNSPPHRSQAWGEAGRLWLAAGEESLAQAAYESAVSSAPQDEEAFRKLYELYQNQGDHDSCLALLSRASTEATTEERKHELTLLQAGLLSKTGEQASAIKALEDVIAAAPHHPHALLALARQLSESHPRRAEGALLEVTRSSNQVQLEVEGYRALAKLYTDRLESPRKAERCYREVLSRIVDDPTALAQIEKLTQ